jgi:hypothetical protein
MMGQSVFIAAVTVTTAYYYYYSMKQFAFSYSLRYNLHDSNSIKYCLRLNLLLASFA